MERSSRETKLLEELGLIRSREQLKHDMKLDQRSPEWHERRRLMLTASDCPIALGQSYTHAPLYCTDVILFKTDRKQRHVTPAMARGLQREAEAADEYLKLKQAAAAQGHCVTLHETGLHVHPDHGWLGASFDRIVEERDAQGNLVSTGVLQIKCPQLMPDKLSEAVTTQVSVELAIADAWELRAEGERHSWVDVFVCPEKGPPKLFPRLVYDKRQSFGWKLYTLPRLAAFYFNNLAPALLAYCKPRQPELQIAAAALPAEPAATPPRGAANQLPATAALSGPAATQSPVPVAFTPSLAVGKFVTSIKRGAEIGQVISTNPILVRWPGAQRVRAMSSTQDLAVYPLRPDDPVVHPTREGQPVVVLRGEYSDRHGVTVRQTGSKWQVQLQAPDGCATVEALLEGTILHAKAQEGDAEAKPVSA